MKVVRLSLIAVLLVAGSLAIAASQVNDYPLEIQTVQVSQSVKKDVVHVKLADGSKPALNDFMEKIVPAALRTTGTLPAPSDEGTLLRRVEIPLRGSAYIFNKDSLPLWLRVRASQSFTKNVREDRHERFDGNVKDPWDFESYFITKYTAICRATKVHDSKAFTYVQPKEYKGTHKTFHWVDP